MAVAILVLGAVVAFADPFTPLKPLEVAVEETPQSSDPVETAQSAPVVEEDPEQKPEPDPQQFVIAAAGDVLTHVPVAYATWNGERYQFSSKMSGVTPYLDAADVSICNMELPVRAPGEPPIGYPVFGAPYELVEELGIAGFTGCSTATNHAMDQGWDGLVRTLNAFEAAGMGHKGTARTEYESQQAQFYTIEREEVTLTVANIAATYGTNGIFPPVGNEWGVHLIDTDLLIQQAQSARAEGADVVVASVHCCYVEYYPEIEPIQYEIAEILAASGEVDILLNHHAHVPKPLGLVPGGPSGEGMWTAYGLGNFISNQGVRHNLPKETESGLLTFFYIDFDGVRPPKVTEATWATVTVDYDNGFNLIVAHDEGIVTAQQAERATMSPEEMVARRQVVADIMALGDGAEQVGLPANKPGVTTVIPKVQEAP